MNILLARRLCRRIAVLLLAGALCGPAFASLATYRDYPSQIARNTDFSLSVTDGSTTIAPRVWNSIRSTSGALQSGDNWRRFAEFATNSTVTVTVTANAWTVSQWEVIPSMTTSITNQTVSGNTVSFRMSSGGKVVVRVNQDFNKMCAIFSDPPEPAVNPANYTYYYGPSSTGAGKFYDIGVAGENQDATSDLLTISTANASVYIAAGCVVNGRIKVTASGVTIDGRGILRDGSWFKDPNGHLSMVWTTTQNLTVRNIKVLDTNWFNLITSGSGSATYTNLKLLSNQRNSDGVHILGPSTVDDCFMHVGDDVSVLYNTAGVFKNSLLGTVCGSYNVSANITASVRISNNVHFRMSGGGPIGASGVFSDSRHGLISYFMDGTTTSTISDFKMMHIDASPALWCRQLFYGNGQGAAAKTFVLQDVTIPTPGPNEAIRVLSSDAPAIGNVTLKLSEVSYGTSRIENRTEASILDQGSPATVLRFSDVIDDFDDNNASDWSTSIGSGAGSVAVTSSTSVPDSSLFSGNIVYTRTGTSYEYAILRGTTATLGERWSTYGRTGLRFWIKGDTANSTSYGSNSFKIQVREGDSGERWEADVSTYLRNGSWTQVSVPFSSMTLVPMSGNNVLDKAALDQVRFYIPSGTVAAGNVHVMIDNIEAY